MQKGNRYYLDKMNENVDFILEHMDGVTKDMLEEDPVLLDSMMLRLVQISENASLHQLQAKGPPVRRSCLI